MIGSEEIALCSISLAAGSLLALDERVKNNECQGRDRIEMRRRGEPHNRKFRKEK